MPLAQRVWEARSKVDLMTQDWRYRYDHLGGTQLRWPDIHAHRRSLLYDCVGWVLQAEVSALLGDSLCERLCHRLDATLHPILLCPPPPKR